MLKTQKKAHFFVIKKDGTGPAVAGADSHLEVVPLFDRHTGFS